MASSSLETDSLEDGRLELGDGIAEGEELDDVEVVPPIALEDARLELASGSDEPTARREDGEGDVGELDETEIVPPIIRSKWM